MAEDQLDLEAFFSHSVPSLFRQAERNVHNNDLNVLEYFEQRLDDYIYVIGSVIRQCEYHRHHHDHGDGLVFANRGIDVLVRFLYKLLHDLHVGFESVFTR